MDNPLTLKIIFLKTDNQYLSYSEIGEKLNITKQAVEYRINTALLKFPMLQSLIMIDKRYYPKNKSKKAICHKKNIHDTHLTRKFYIDIIETMYLIESFRHGPINETKVSLFEKAFKGETKEKRELMYAMLMMNNNNE